MRDQTAESAVRNLQRYLRRLSEEENGILPVPVDGIFDTRTEEALMEFQRLFSLPVTGRADRETWELLFSEYLRLSEEKDRAEAIDFFPSVPQNYVTALGEESALILLLQFLLSELRASYDALPDLKQSGRFDAETSDAVRIFQRIQGIGPTGLVDRNTWNRIAKEYALLSQNLL